MHQQHFSWIESYTHEEERLLNKIYKFEEKYFSDLTLKDYKIDLTEYRNNVFGTSVTTYCDLLICKNVSFIDNNWKVKLLHSSMHSVGWHGSCNGKEQLILIAENHEDKEYTLLHEMIHGYEFMLVLYCSPCVKPGLSWNYKQIHLVFINSRI